MTTATPETSASPERTELVAETPTTRIRPRDQDSTPSGFSPPSRMTRMVSPASESAGVGSGDNVRAQFTLNPNHNLNPNPTTFVIDIAVLHLLTKCQQEISWKCYTGSQRESLRCYSGGLESRISPAAVGLLTPMLHYFGKKQQPILQPLYLTLTCELPMHPSEVLV